MRYDSTLYAFCYLRCADQACCLGADLGMCFSACQRTHGLVALQSMKRKLVVGEQLHVACRDVGFFYVHNHGMPAEVQEGVLRQARRWFALPVSAPAPAWLCLHRWLLQACAPPRPPAAPPPTHKQPLLALR
jgi:hypothetical protein